MYYWPDMVRVYRFPWSWYILVLLNTGRGIGTETDPWVGQCVSSWWPHVWVRYWTRIVLLNGIDMYMPNWWGNGWSIVFCPFRTRVVLHWLYLLSTKSLILEAVNIIVYKFIKQWVYSYNMEDDSCNTPSQSVGLFWCVCCSAVECYILLLY